MNSKKAYCHTTYRKIGFDEYIDFESSSYYIVQYLENIQYSISFHKYGFESEDPSFNDYFYTEQEYNRDLNLDKLLSNG